MAKRFVADVASSELAVNTFKEGLLSAVGHNLKLTAKQWSLESTGEGGAYDVSLTVDATSLAVAGHVQVDGDGLVKEESLAPMDSWSTGQITSNMQGKYVLDVARFPTVSYAGALKLSDDGPSVILGSLTLHGTTKELPLHVTATPQPPRDGKACFRWQGEVYFLQSEWGMTPFYTMMGAIKLKDRVRVTWDFYLVEA
eukprot:TRINITY_DN19001_c0_g1_i1.p3 TRINITY_DN19001_c0_g1~~TRINITY_DN19001_c0_g1_i1.p3  ORF type:complete len:198 (+),score=78.59 TRINITY_DN19001_c0_g1_i1:67-660(+)